MCECKCNFLLCICLGATSRELNELDEQQRAELLVKLMVDKGFVRPRVLTGKLPEPVEDWKEAGLRARARELLQRYKEAGLEKHEDEELKGILDRFGFVLHEALHRGALQ